MIKKTLILYLYESVKRKNYTLRAVKVKKKGLIRKKTVEENNAKRIIRG